MTAWTTPLGDPASIAEVHAVATAGIKAAARGDLGKAREACARLDSVGEAFPNEEVCEASWYAARIAADAIRSMTHMHSRADDAAARAATEAYSRGYSDCITMVGAGGVTE